MKTIDGHAHLYGGVEGIDALAETARALGFAGMNIACIPSPRAINTNPPGLAAKSQHPELFYFFAGLDHAGHFTKGAVKSPPLAEQAERMAALGADGFKLLEAKPTSRRWLGLAVDGPYFADFFAAAERLGLPLLCHTADPEEFWDPALTPKWAVSRGWAYDASFLPKEAHYAEVERVLERHPGLKVVLPHFYFLSADLARAERFLARFPNACFDLAPGVELIYNLSRDPAAARDFFVRHADRIVFGTDIGILPDMTLRQSERRAGLVLRFLSTGAEFGVDPEADFLLEPPPGAVGRGLNLPKDALGKVLAGNFERLAGRAPRPLDRKLAREECLRLARSFDALPGEKNPALHPARAAELLG